MRNSVVIECLVLVVDLLERFALTILKDLILHFVISTMSGRFAVEQVLSPLSFISFSITLDHHTYMQKVSIDELEFWGPTCAFKPILNKMA